MLSYELVPLTIKPHQQISFPEAFLGLTFAPAFTTAKLMAVGHRTYAPTCLICLVLTLFVPIWAIVFKYNLVGFNSPEVHSAVISIITALGVYYIFGLLLAALMRLDLDTRATLNVITYSLTPLNLGLWIIFAFNYAYAGRLTIITYFLTGAGNVNDLFFGQLPVACAIILFWVLLDAYYCVINGSEDSGAQGFAYILLLAPGAILSIALGLFVGDVIRPGFLNAMLRLFRLLP